MSNRPADLDRFRDLQRLAYEAAEHVASRLEPGVTERMATRALRRWLERHGVDDWFHVPFAWFGERTAFRGFRIPTQFLPTNRRLAEGMPYVLDCAPVMDGYVADIGYSGVLGSNPGWSRLDHDLSGFRVKILDLVRQRRTFREIYREVDAEIAAQGNRNRHQVYPGRVIGHQVARIRLGGPRFVVFESFGIRTLRTVGRELVKERLEGRSPLWAGGRASAHPPTPGLWAVEPHLGTDGDRIGAKFEEILVVTDDDAYWLDDDLPHVRRWSLS
ncbi:M24 family metallopeptidase [Nonomuraea sp. NPDC050536]|uniref:M24 family metallopeptidase n=1 Tax=Nonomuraea sp. NPDC050536 TaxID=3364366 RepID=UPI0037C6C0BF